MSYIIVGRDEGKAKPELAVGPFGDYLAADEFRGSLERATRGRYFILPLHTPTDQEVPK
jgi:hypothetical protein